MQLQTPQGQQIAAQLSQALTALGDLDKVSPVDAELIWQHIVAHVRSARPQSLLALKDVP